MADWKISTGTPYLDEFPEMFEITEYPNSSWQIYDDIPYLNAFPGMYIITEHSETLWHVSNDTPYLNAFPRMRKFNDAPSTLWIIADDIPYLSVFPPMPAAPILETVKDDDTEISVPEFDWSASMQQTFEYYEVDPGTWKNKRLITTVRSSSIDRDSESDTLGSATIDLDELIGECYIRIYLVTIQNGITRKFPLGTFLVQTPSSSFNGKIRHISVDAYTPLIELKESRPPLGYFISKKERVMDHVNRLTREHLRAPVVETTSTSDRLYDDFIADPNDTWISYISDLMSNAKFSFGLDELGRIIFEPNQEIEKMQATWTYNDDNSSILYPDIDIEHDLYGVPNVVEVIYSTNGNTGDNSYFYAKVVNDDPNSPTSTVSRGREIVYRETDPSIIGNPTEREIQEYAEQLLKNASSITYSVTYTHAYCPVKVGDCVRLNYESAGISDVKAKVVSQKITCRPGCPVTEKAVFTTKLWR